MTEEPLEYAIFAGGCFWCTEAVFQRLIGVYNVVSGYTGGKTKNPFYKEVITGNTGHAEAIKIGYNSRLITYDELLQVFFATHDPTTLNRQGADKGTQYRSAIFYLNTSQKKSAEKMIQKLTDSHVYENTMVTEVSEAGTFYEAETYHQDYYNQNKTQTYCQYVINPKLEKLYTIFRYKIKN